jgi:hypothetical protein
MQGLSERLARERDAVVDIDTGVDITWLLAAASNGDQDAFERLYAATSAKLYGVVLRIVRRHDLAATVMEDAYLAIWNSAGEFNPAQSSALAWMVAIARRLAIDVSRQSGATEGEPEVVEENEGPASAGWSRIASACCFWPITGHSAVSSSRSSSICPLICSRMRCGAA